MPFITGDLELDDIGNGNYRLLADVVYRTADGDIILAPQGMETDLRSSPAIVSNIIVKIGGKADKPAVLHDFLYRSRYIMWMGVCSARLYTDDESEAKGTSDQIFLDAMTDEGDGYFDRYASYWGVDLFGKSSWNGQTVESINAYRLIYKRRMQLLEG